MLNEEEEGKYKAKCRDLKRRIDEIDAGSDALEIKLDRTKKYIRRLRLERSLLLDKFEVVVGEISAATDDGSGRRVSPTPPRSPPLEVVFHDAPIEVRLSPPREDSPHGRLATPGNAGAADEANASTTKPSKRKRDPLEPKRPKNAFLRFCETEREHVKAAVEAQAVEGEQVDIAREMGRVWSGMDDVARRPFYEAYEHDRKRYEKEYADYKGHDLPAPRKSRANRPSASQLAISAARAAQGDDSVMIDAGTPARSPSRSRHASPVPHSPRADRKDPGGEETTTATPSGGGFTAMNR